MTTFLRNGVGELVERYPAWVLDVWGTLYDGGTVFPGARDVMERLAERDVPVAVLSNSPRQPEIVAGRLADLGIGPELYRIIVTSGGETRRHLMERPDAFHGALGARVHTFAPSRFGDILPGTGFEMVDRIEDAEWLLNAGPAGEFDQVAAYEDLLAAGAARKLPMICANPDHAVYDRGRLKVHAGALAARYEALGGTVHYHGKPHTPVFERVASLLEVSVAELLMVGDNRDTDVAGAVRAGAGSLLLADGIHRERLAPDSVMQEAAVLDFLGEPGPVPDLVAGRLSW